MESFENKKSRVELVDRREMTITGVEKLHSFNEKEFLLDTVLGTMTVRGSGMMLGRMDTDNGQLNIKGTIDSMSYTKARVDRDEPLWKKIFK